MTRPNDVEEALARARQHGRTAAAEATAAVRALLDAAALGTTGKLSGEVPGLHAVDGMLDDLHRWLEGGQASTAVVVALADALESEIRRWEARSAQDEEARAVLRAFLGLRELLWELGVRTSAHESAAPEPPPERAARPTPKAAPAPAASKQERPRQAARAARVHHIPVEG